MPDVVQRCELCKGYYVMQDRHRLTVYVVQGILRHATLHVARQCMQSKGDIGMPNPVLS